MTRLHHYVLEKANSAEQQVDKITDLVNQITVAVLPAKWRLSTIVNCYKGKGDGFKRGNCRGMKLTDQILKVVPKVMIQLGFMSGRRTTNAILIMRRLQEKHLVKKEIAICISRSGEFSI